MYFSDIQKGDLEDILYHMDTEKTPDEVGYVVVHQDCLDRDVFIIKHDEILTVGYMSDDGEIYIDDEIHMNKCTLFKKLKKKNN